MEFRCPHCQAPIYSRKNKNCGVCEKPLPKELLLNGGQIAFLKKQDEQQEKRAKQFHLPDLTHGEGVSGFDGPFF